MKLAAILAGLVILGTIAKGGGTAVTQSASTEQKDQAPLWSTDLTGDYTLGSKIMKSADFGSQSVSHYEFEVLRSSLDLTPKDSTFHDRTAFTLPLYKASTHRCHFRIGPATISIPS